MLQISFCKKDFVCPAAAQAGLVPKNIKLQTLQVDSVSLPVGSPWGGRRWVSIFMDGITILLDFCRGLNQQKHLHNIVIFWSMFKYYLSHAALKYRKMAASPNLYILTGAICSIAVGKRCQFLLVGDGQPI